MLDERDLSRREGDHLKFRTVAEEHLEVVKITSGRAEDDA